LSIPYNPLSKLNLARSIEGEILGRSLQPLDNLETFEGAGIYALYYSGKLPIYQPLTLTLTTENPRPIYVGKAIPKGGRTGGLREGDIKTRALVSRLRKHARSIDLSKNLQIEDFLVRYLIVDDVWIPLGENMLIETYKPVWNKVIAGFGNNPLGKGRENQKVSLWDILHPGRISDVKENQQVASQADLADRVKSYFAGEAVPETEERDENADEE
jgi:hypothetical protein